MNILEYLCQLRPAIPMSIEKPCTQASNGEIRRWLRDGAVHINGKRVAATDPAPESVRSLVFFPNSERRRTTVV